MTMYGLLLCTHLAMALRQCSGSVQPYVYKYDQCYFSIVSQSCVRVSSMMASSDICAWHITVSNLNSDLK